MATDVAPIAVWRRQLVNSVELSSNEKLVALVLSDYWNASGTCAPFGGVPVPGAGPSIDTLAAQCRLGRSTVKRALAALEREGVVKVTHRGKGRGSNRYVMHGVRAAGSRRRRKEAAANDDLRAKFG